MKSLIDDSVITFDEIKDTLDTSSKNSNDENIAFEIDYYSLDTFLSVTMLLLMIIIVYNYYTK